MNASANRFGESTSLSKGERPSKPHSKEIAMFYTKNVPGWERAIRIAMVDRKLDKAS